MKVEISTDAVGAMLWEAARDRHREVCGLLLGRDLKISHIVPTLNVAADPANAFEVDPAVVVDHYRRMREGGPQVIGCYHSHPGGAPLPSRRDAVASSPAMPVWIIIAGDRFGAFLVDEHGPIVGRFTLVDVHTLPAGCTTVMPSPQGDSPFASVRKSR